MIQHFLKQIIENRWLLNPQNKIFLREIEKIIIVSTVSIENIVSRIKFYLNNWKLKIKCL